MKLPLVSVIIPFHNTANYLEQCIQSVASQTYKSIEIVLIDDGSTDGASTMAKAYEADHKNVLYKKTQHLGPGNARNVGIALSTGSLLVFVDSDDLLLPEMVSMMTDTILEQNADIAMCNFELFKEDGSVIQNNSWGYSRSSIQGPEAARGIYKNQITFTVWGKIYRKSLIENIRFPVEGIFEDRLFMLKVFLKAGKIHFRNDVLLKIRVRQESLTRKLIQPKRIEDLTTIYNHELAHLKIQNVKEMTYLVHAHQLRALGNSFFMLQKHEKLDANVQPVRRVLMKHLIQFKHRAFKQLNFKDKIYLFLLQLPRYTGWTVARFIMKIIFPKKQR